jgi:N utilization substance protein B
MKGEPPAVVLGGLPVPPDPFTAKLLRAAEAQRAVADQLIEDAATGWTLKRLAVIDRLVLVLAVCELLDPDGAPLAVVIDEAVELAKAYSTDDSGSFVNGVLSTIAAQVR